MSPSSQQLALFFPFDEIEDGQVLDASGNGNDGVARGSPRILPDDTFGSCLDLDGNAALVLTTESVPAGGAITVSFWARGGPSQPADNSILCALDANGVRTVNIHLPWGDGTIYFDCGGEGPSFDRIQKAAQPGDYKGAWSHWAFVKDTAVGEMRIYLNGALWHSGAGLTRPIAAAAQVTLGAYTPELHAYQGQVANLRIYGRALPLEEIARDMDDDRTANATFRTSSPLDFYLRDADDQDVMYIDDDPQTDDLRLGITNTARQAIELAASRNPGAVSAGNHHFELRFRPGTLSTATLSQLALEDSGWKLTLARQTDGGASIYLLSTEPLQLQPSATIELRLRHISADPGGGSRGTRVELSYQQMQYQGETIPLGGNRIKHLDIVNQRGKKTIPLNVGFVGSSTVLNDGSTKNTLVLRLTNVSPTDTIALHPSDHKTPSKFIISFDAGGEWALGTAAQINAISVAAMDWGGSQAAESDWHIQKEAMGAASQWTLTHLNKTEPGLAPGHVVQLTIGNIVSSAPSGQTNLYVRYENIPGYWDGQFFRTVEKGPLLTVGQNVGIGTQPSAPLHVKGQVRIEGQMLVGEQFRLQTDHPGGGTNATVIELLPNYQNDVGRTRVNLYAPNFYYTNVPAITLAGNYGGGASVGIGTTEPAAPLHVKGEARVEGLSHVVGAGLIGDGNNYAHGAGSMAAGSLTIGSTTASYGGGANWNANVAGLLLETAANTEIAVHDANTRIASLMYYEGDAANRITIGRDMAWGAIGTLVLNGNVGIGTSSPGAKLDVAQGAGLVIRTEPAPASSVHIGRSGENSLQFDYAWGTALNSTASISLNIDSNKDDTERYIDFRTGGAGFSGGSSLLRVQQNGNVGIGLTSPVMTLDVNGGIFARARVYCGGGVAAWSNGFWRFHNGEGWQQTTGPNYGVAVPRSDMRLKRDVRTLTGALGQVLGLRGVTFNWNDLGLERLTRYVETYDAGPGASEEATRQLQAAKRAEAYELLARPEIGLIAQEVRRVAPELVSEDEDGYQGVAYERVVALLIEAIKEQQAAIEALSEKVAAAAV